MKINLEMDPRLDNDNAVELAVNQIWRHVARGTYYEIIAFAVLQIEDEELDNTLMVVYGSIEPAGSYYTRPLYEFTDGRFARLGKWEYMSTFREVVNAWRYESPDMLIDSTTAPVWVIAGLAVGGIWQDMKDDQVVMVVRSRDGSEVVVRPGQWLLNDENDKFRVSSDLDFARLYRR